MDETVFEQIIREKLESLSKVTNPYPDRYERNYELFEAAALP